MADPATDPNAATPPTDPAGTAASSSDPAAEAPPAESADVGRRRFFRQFAGELVQTAATMVGAAQALQQVSAEAASAILNPAGAEAAVAAAITTADPNAGATTGPSGFRTPFREDNGVLYLIDQRKLPDQLVEYPVKSAGETAWAIREMVVRGAPAIGQVAAIGLAMSAENQRDGRPYARKATIRGSANALINARPTAVNLRWAVERVLARYTELDELSEDGAAIADAMREEADRIVFEATTDHGRLATFGLDILPTPDDRPVRILTHCNTGPLACGQYGTALGVVQAAHHAGRPLHVWVDETRPYLQGARLTTWELAQAGVPHSLLPDVAAGHLMARGEVDVILVGADRVAANGDTANKVGTYTLAVLAARHGIPFYVCAPTSTVDLATADGSDIDIEERRAEEVTEIRGVRIAPPGHGGPQPVIRRHPGRADHRDRDRGRGHPGALRDRPARRGRERGGTVGVDARLPRVPADGRGDTAAGRRPDRTCPGGGLMASVAVGRRGGVVARATTDKAVLRSFLERDRLYAAYAICDLEEREFSRTHWAMAWDGDQPVALVLEYNGPTPQPLFVMGRDDGIAAILRDLIRPRIAYVAAPASVLPAIETAYRVEPGPSMVRMWVDRAHFRPYPATVQRLLPVEIGDLNKLYQLGFASWLPSSAIADGVYYGLRVNGQLVSAAGTHVVSPGARLAVVGNVLTHSDYRGRGFATAVTGAVTAELLRTCDQVVLNVRSDNPPALNAYRRLGYADHIRFEERLVHRLGSPWPDFAASLRRLFARKETDTR